MQEVQYQDGSFARKFFQARNEAEVKEQMAREYAETMKRNDVESIRQSVLDEDSRCPCGSGKLTKNCCVKRLRRYVANQKHFAKV